MYKLGGNLVHEEVLCEELKSTMLFALNGNSSEFSEVAGNFPYELRAFFSILKGVYAVLEEIPVSF